MKPIRVQKGWRFTLAKAALRFLFNRKDMYFSPWYSAGIGTAVIFHRDGKVLLAQRAGNIEQAGAWANVGGHLDIDKHEGIIAGLVREVKEETTLEIPVNAFHENAPFCAALRHGKEMIDMENYSTLSLYYLYELSPEEEAKMQLTEETAAYKWVDQKELEHMIAAHEVVHPDVMLALRKFFAYHAGEKTKAA